MAKKKKTRFIGSCGIYVVVKCDGCLWLLVQRRSRQVSEPNTICSPGGIVERCVCEQGGQFDFECGAQTTALNELREETGIVLDDASQSSMYALPIGPGAYWGAEFHRNYCVVLDVFPDVAGPEKASRHEIVLGGVDGIGTAAGDGYHAWVEIQDLLSRTDLMPASKVPLQHIVANGVEAAGSSSQILADPERKKPQVSLRTKVAVPISSSSQTRMPVHSFGLPIRGITPGIKILTSKVPEVRSASDSVTQESPFSYSSTAFTARRAGYGVAKQSQNYCVGEVSTGATTKAVTTARTIPAPKASTRLNGSTRSQAPRVDMEAVFTDATNVTDPLVTAAQSLHATRLAPVVRKGSVYSRLRDACVERPTKVQRV